MKIPCDFISYVDALSSGVKLATEGDVKCYTNSSQRCNYTWYNSKNETVSKDEKLVKQKPGQYKCRAQCEMNQQNDQLCGFIAMEVQVVSPGNELMNSVTLPWGSSLFEDKTKIVSASVIVYLKQFS